MTLRRRITASVVGLLLLGSAACSSGTHSADPSDGPTTTANGAAACDKVPAADVSALGLSGPGTPTTFGSPVGTALASCTFGSAADPAGLLLVQVETRDPGAKVDPLQIIVDSLTTELPKPASTPKGAKVYSAAALQGGVGVGRTVAWQDKGHVVAVSRTGETVDLAALEALTAHVVAKL